MKNTASYYLDYQATTPVDSRVLAEMVPYFENFFGNPHTADHARGWKTMQAVNLAAGRIATMIGSDPDEVIFTSGATEANNLALLGLARRAAGGNRSRILVSAIEHKCVLAAGRAVENELGFTVEQIRVDRTGRLSLACLENLIGDDVLAVSVMAVNNEIGTIQDLAAIARIARSHGAIFHCDAAQAPCAFNISDLAQHTDLASLSSHKMHGPMGIGALYIRRDLHCDIEPLIHGGGQQNNLRSGTLPTPLCVGMGAAAALIHDQDSEAERARLAQLRDRFVQKLLDLPYQVKLNGPPSGIMRHPGNANIRFIGFHAQDILAALQPFVEASSGSACSSGIPEPSHVLREIGLTKIEADASIRFCVGRETSREDIDNATAIITGTIHELAREDAIRTA